MVDRSWREHPRPHPTATRHVTPLFRPFPGPVIPLAEGFRHPLAPRVAAHPPTLLPLITADAELDPALERILQPAAERARAGDREARDALYRAFEPKLRRFTRRIRVPFAPTGSATIWDRNDVLQEAYLVFVGLFDTWDPVVPFGRYVFATFPWRLRDAVHRVVARRGAPPHARVVPLDPRFTGVDATARMVEQEILLEALMDTFEPPLDAVLRLHILDRLSLTQAALQLGISRRTITRHWQAIMVRLRATDPAERRMM